MNLKVGDKVVLITKPTHRGEVITLDNDNNIILSVKIKWDEGTPDKMILGVLLVSQTSWVNHRDIMLDKQVLRDNRLNELGI